ncbi:proto-oncogene FRAT1-like [Heteronotia binoei]|uniref:proto-oncogene FRAT1-like n=1 Tax=Heteronotia binoei TaxID=13085 RepID=UPI00292F238E|nr:proto-oncogene FRAT1-like [Heteronotia binoei]
MGLEEPVSGSGSQRFVTEPFFSSSPLLFLPAVECARRGRHPLFTNQPQHRRQCLGSECAREVAGGRLGWQLRTPAPQKQGRRSYGCRARAERGKIGVAAMPCRRTGGERFLLLERTVSLQSSPVGGSIGSKEVDALVAKLGEVLQLSAQHRTPPPRLPKHHGRDRAAPYSAPRGLGFLASLHRQPPHQRPPPSLLLLPPPPPPPPSSTDKKGSPRVAKQLCGRGWLRSAARAGGKKPRRHPLLPAGDDDEEEDPHRLLQQLILSGNLIKEAVRRLQLAASTAVGESNTNTTGSPSSASSAGSCHSSSGEGDSAAPPATTAAFAVSSLQPLP